MKTILHDLFQKTEQEGVLPSSFYGASIVLIVEVNKDRKEGRESRKEGGETPESETLCKHELNLVHSQK